MADGDSDGPAPTSQEFLKFIKQLTPSMTSWWQPADPPLPFFKRLAWSFMGAAFGIIYITLKRFLFGEAAHKITERLPLADDPVWITIIVIIAGGSVSLGLASIISSTHKSGNPIRLFFETILLLAITVYVLDLVGT